MNISDVLKVLCEARLDEGLFLQGNFKDKKGLTASTTNIIYDIFSKPIAEELLEAIGRTKFKTMPLFSRDRKDTGAYTNGAFMNDKKDFLDKHKKEYYKKLDYFNKSIEKTERRVAKNLDNQKIVLNSKYIKKEGDAYPLVIIHELIHVAYPFSKSLVKACEDIYKIFKENWNPDGGTFYISKVLVGSLDRDNSSSRKSEILPYIISDDIHTEFLTEEGTHKLIDYLKNSGLLNLGDEGKKFWDDKFNKMLKSNNKGVSSFYKQVYNYRKKQGLPSEASD